MTLLYRLLGAVARLSERLSHTRINFIPLNLALICGVAVVFGLGITQTRDAVINGTKPRQITITEALAHPGGAQNYVTVHGELHPEAGFQLTRKSQYSDSKTVEAAYVPMLDPDSHRALIVKRKENDFENAEPADTQITGMVIPMDSELRSRLVQEGGKIDDVPLDTEYMLEEGRSPGNVMTWGIATALSGILLAAFGITLLQKYVVFQKTGAPMMTPASSADTPQKIDLRVTGKFVLDGQNAQRFLNVPAGLVKLDTGELAFVSNIDASNKFFGVTTAERKGFWSILLQPNSLSTLEWGNLYDGLASRPAVRLRYQDSHTQRQASAILSCASQAEREIVLTELSRMAGVSLRPT